MELGKEDGRVLNFARRNIVQRYHELLHRKLTELRTDVYTFFRLAHVWSFGTDPDLSNEVAQYRMHAVIPKYVCTYLDSLTKGET
jgi:hypothetical protein